MTINETQDQIIEEFSMFEEWMDKYEYLIDFSKNIPELSQEEKTDDILIEGCQARVWLKAEYHDGKVKFKADSDAIITKGIAALLIRVFNNHSPAEIKDADLYFIDKIGLKENLSPTRSNGLVAMVKQMKMYALAFEKRNKQH